MDDDRKLRFNGWTSKTEEQTLSWIKRFHVLEYLVTSRTSLCNLSTVRRHLTNYHMRGVVNSLVKLGIVQGDVQLLKNLDWHEVAKINTRVWYDLWLNRNLQRILDGIRINGVTIQSIRYAYDTAALVVDTDIGLRKTTHIMTRRSRLRRRSPW